MRLATTSAALLTMLGGVAQAASANTTGAALPPPSTSTPIQTQTVLSASSDTVASTGKVRITATVHPGIFVTPSGAVTFKDATKHTRLGTVKPGRQCLLTSDPCPMSITVRGKQLKPGANTITANYSGDIGETPSSDSIVITRTDTNQPVTTTCTDGESQCVTPTDTSVDGTADASIATFGEVSGTETISVSFQTTELPCSTPDTGDALVFSSTNAPSEKDVTYTVFGTAADIANAAYGSEGNICLGSTAPFVTKGVTPPVLEPDGLYYGLLPECASNDVVPPCIEPATFTPAGEGGPSQDEYTENAIVSADDPKMTH